MEINKENSINNLIENIFNSEDYYNKYYSSTYSNNDNRYFTSKYVLKDKYIKSINYFIFKDNYPDFRSNVNSTIHPIIPSTRTNLGQGFYGINFLALNSIFLNENNVDTGEVFLHEQLHSSNPSLSEKEVRDLVRIKLDHTYYH